MKKVFISALLLSVQHYYSTAQSKGFNTYVQGNITSFYLPVMDNFFNPSQAGIGIGRKVYKNLSAELAYSFWLGGSNSGFALQKITTSDENTAPKEWEGQLDTRYNYHFIDLNAKYNLNVKHHNLYGMAGFSFASGKDQYVDRVFQQPGYRDFIVYLGNKIPKNYLGIDIGLGYNYAFIKNRITIGASGKARYYSNQFTMYDLSFNVGYNFNLLSK